MCIAVPGRVVSIEGGRAKVDYSGNIIEVDVRLVDAKPGDYVLVHAGCAIEVMKEDQARDLAELLREIEELANERG
jgi:hydrogenase expression/formation protein HypC